MNNGFDKVHQPCPLCNSSDAVGINTDGSAKCFSCGEFMPDYNKLFNGESVMETTTKKSSYDNPVGQGTFADLTDRRISKATAQKYGVTALHDKAGDVIQHFYPYYNGHELSATKTRYSKDKRFYLSGSFENTGLFGQQLFKQAKYITITEGECDAMATYELLGSKWAVVSIKRGSAGAEKDVKESLEFLEQFENIIIAFDNDKAGKEASVKVARLFKPAKCKIMTMPNGWKDPNDMLKNKLIDKIINEPLGGAHYDPNETFESVKENILLFHKKIKSFDQ